MLKVYAEERKKELLRVPFLPGSVLSSHELAMLFSPLRCLTSVFGMGTGVSISLSPPDLLRSFPQNQITVTFNFQLSSSSCSAFQVIKSSTY